MLRTLLAGLGATGALAAIAADQVTSLPGWNQPLPTNMYSGYLTIPGGKRLHYLFSESLRNPSTDPIVAWFNGGPGCSSLEGAFYELGLLTFVPGSAPNSQLQLNPYSWNNQSNVLYIEAPAGVGFSYADSAAGLVHNDSSTAADNLAAVQQFFAGFPEFQTNDLYIAGESFAGIYVPTLAYAIYLTNQALPAGQTGINLKGVMVGNGCIGNAAGVCGNDPQGPMWNIEQWKGHALISPGLYGKIMSTCNFTALPYSTACSSLLTQASKMVGPINIYDVYQACENVHSPAPGANAGLFKALHASGLTTAAQKRQFLARSRLNSSRRPLQQWEMDAALQLAEEQADASLSTDASSEMSLGGPITCIDAAEATPYFNSDAVRSALNMPPLSSGLAWQICTGNSSFSYTPTEADVTTVIYPTLLNAGIRVLIYSGDADLCIPVTSTANWVSNMPYSPLPTQWKAWLSQTGIAPKVGGYVSKWGGNPAANGQPVDLTFTTILGAGHMVPQFNPPAGWQMFNNFVFQQPW